MLSIYKRELKRFFSTPVTGIMLAVTMLFIGFMFKQYNIDNAFTNFGFTLYSSLIIFCLLAAYLTGFAIADERKRHTSIVEASDVCAVKVILGKYLAQLTVVAIPLVISISCPFVIKSFGYCYIGGEMMSILATFLAVAVLCAIGTFVSGTTSNPIIATAVGFVALAVVCIWDDLCLLIGKTEVNSLVGFFIIIAILSVILYVLTRRIVPTVIFAAAACAVNTVVFFVTDGVYYNLFIRAMRSLSVPAALYNMCEYYVFDFVALFLYVSVAALFLFLAVRKLKHIRQH